MYSFAYWVEAQIKESGLMHKELDKMGGFSDGNISKWRRGHCLPNMRFFIVFCECIARVTNKPLDYVLIDGLRAIDEYKHAEKRLEDQRIDEVYQAFCECIAQKIDKPVSQIVHKPTKY